MGYIPANLGQTHRRRYPTLPSGIASIEEAFREINASKSGQPSRKPTGVKAGLCWLVAFDGGSPARTRRRALSSFHRRKAVPGN